MRNDAIITTEIQKATDDSRALSHALNSINDKLDREIGGKQKLIEEFIGKIAQLEHSLEQKNSTIAEKEEQLKDCLKQGEGNKQLINKLLGDIERLNQDIEWYKRTYEKRSFWGTMKEKLFITNKK